MTYLRPYNTVTLGGNRALSESIVCALPLQESGGDAYDLTGQLNFTVSSAPGSAAGPSTAIPRARDFDGTDDYLYVSAEDVQYLDLGGTHSVTLWCYADTIPANPALISQFNTGTLSRGSFIGVNTTDDDFSYYTDEDGNSGGGDSTFADHDQPTGPVVSTWYMVFVGYDGSDKYICANAETIVQDAGITVFAPSTASNLSIGASNTTVTADSFWDGRIAQVIYYDKLLSQAEVTWIYNSGNGRVLTGGNAR